MKYLYDKFKVFYHISESFLGRLVEVLMQSLFSIVSGLVVLPDKTLSRFLGVFFTTTVTCSTFGFEAANLRCFSLLSYFLSGIRADKFRIFGEATINASFFPILPERRTALSFFVFFVGVKHTLVGVPVLLVRHGKLYFLPMFRRLRAFYLQNSRSKFLCPAVKTGVYTHTCFFFTPTQIFLSVDLVILFEAWAKAGEMLLVFPESEMFSSA